MKISILLRRMFVLALAMTLALPLLPALAEEDAGNAPQNPAVILAANPTTGYTWTFEIADEAGISVARDGMESAIFPERMPGWRRAMSSH